MAYQTYTTKALVCGSKDSYTSDRSYLLFTEEAGMLWATARSVREEKSKQRFALQDFSLIRVSLVKGRSGWRVGSVEAVSNPFLSARSRSERAYVKNIVTLLRRYIHGEQAIPEVFADVIEALNWKPSTEEIDTLHLLLTARMLHTLGYISKKQSLAPVLDAATLAEAIELYSPQLTTELSNSVAEAHQISHL